MRSYFLKRAANFYKLSEVEKMKSGFGVAFALPFKKISLKRSIRSYSTNTKNISGKQQQKLF